MSIEPSPDTASWIELLPPEIRPWAPIVVPWIVFYAPRAANALVNVVQDRFRHDGAETRDIALANGAEMTRSFASTVDALIASGRVTEEQVRKRFDDPGFVKALQDRLLDACETPSKFIHDELASLMAELLTAPVESRRAIMLRSAAAAVRNVNARQARILALAYALLYRGPEPDEESRLRDSTDAVKEYFLAAVISTLEPFNDVEYDYVDINYLAEVGLLTILDRHFTDSQSRLLAPINFSAMSLPPSFHEHPVLVRAQRLLETNLNDERIGLNSIRLTPLGFIVGLCGYRLANGDRFELDSSWDDPTG